MAGTISPWIKCRDRSKDNPLLPCAFADKPRPGLGLSSESMAKLGYITCGRNGCHYLADILRPTDCGYNPFHREETDG